jgi:hypothetical protein
MKKFEIYIYEDFDEFDYLSSKIEKFRLIRVSVKIENLFYKVNFYKKETILRFNEESNVMNSEPGLIIVDSLDLDYLEMAIEHLIIQGEFFENLKGYHSFEDLKYNFNGKNGGKLLKDIKII